MNVNQPPTTKERVSVSRPARDLRKFEHTLSLMKIKNFLFHNSSSNMGLPVRSAGDDAPRPSGQLSYVCSTSQASAKELLLCRS